MHEFPRILFQSISRLQQLPYKNVKQIVIQNLLGNAFCLLPENFLYAMVKEEDSTVKTLGLQTNVALRSK